MRHLLRLSLYVALLTSKSPIFAQAGNAGPTGDQGHFLAGACELVVDPSIKPPQPPLFCLRGKVGGETVISSGPADEDLWGHYADGSLGVYLSSWVSLSGRARERSFYSLGLKSSTQTYRDAEYAVLNLGNPVLHKVRMTIGQMRPPFGIDRPDVDEFYRLSEDRRFWPGPTSTIGLTLDDLRATELNIGFSQYKDHFNLERAILKGATHEVLTARFMRDFAGNGSTRIVVSAGGDSSGARLYGLGFVNKAPNKDTIVFEVVRRLPQPDGSSFKQESVTQVIRAGFIGMYVRDARWIAHFDEERERFRRGLVEFNYRLWDYLILRLGASYRRELGEDVQALSRWSMILGFEGRL